MCLLANLLLLWSTICPGHNPPGWPAAAVRALVADLQDKDPAVRAAAAVKLGRMGKAAMAAAPALVSRLADGDEIVVKRASGALAFGLGPACVEEVAKGLSASNADARRRAAEILALFQSKARPATPALIQSLLDPDANVRERAAYALGEAADPRAIRPLTERVGGDPSFDVRDTAAAALQAYGSAAKGAIPALVKMLGKGGEGAAIALCAIGDEAVPALVDVICEPRNGHVRRAAALYTLECMRPLDDKAARRSIRCVASLLADRDARLRRRAAVIIRDFPATVAKIAVPALTCALGDRDAEVRLNAADALLSVDPTGARAVHELIRLLKAKDHGVKAQAASILGKYPEYTFVAVPALVKTITDPEGHTRAAAVFALGAMGGRAQSALGELQRMARHDPSPAIRDYAAQAARQIQHALDHKARRRGTVGPKETDGWGTDNTDRELASACHTAATVVRYACVIAGCHVSIRRRSGEVLCWPQRALVMR